MGWGGGRGQHHVCVFEMYTILRLPWIPIQKNKQLKMRASLKKDIQHALCYTRACFILSLSLSQKGEQTGYYALWWGTRIVEHCVFQLQIFQNYSYCSQESRKAAKEPKMCWMLRGVVGILRKTDKDAMAMR